MADTNDLSLARDLPHLVANHPRRLAANISIDFVENEHGDFIGSRQNCLKGQHNARQFSRRGYGPKRPNWFARVRCELELQAIQSLKGKSPQMFFKLGMIQGTELDLESALLKAQVSELLAYRFAKLRDQLAAFGRQVFARREDFCFEAFKLGIDQRKLLLALLQAA